MLVGTQQNEVPDSAFEVLPHTPLHAVVKSDLVVRQTQSPGPGRPSIGQIRTAGAGVHHAAVGGHRWRAGSWVICPETVMAVRCGCSVTRMTPPERATARN
jgi:hypothetical protein